MVLKDSVSNERLDTILMDTKDVSRRGFHFLANEFH